MKPFGFEKPLGMRDTLPQVYHKKDRFRQKIARGIQGWGYQFVETPALEYYDTVGTATSIEERQLFKLLDQEGKTVVLRPDMTAPIARIAASSLKDEALPLRLAYDASVFRAQQREGGRPAEFEQIGIELIGDGSVSADAEVIALMVNVMKRAGLDHFQVVVGHIGYVNALLYEVTGDEKSVGELRRYLFEKNYVGFRRFVEDMDLARDERERLLALLELRGGHEVIDKAGHLIDNEQGKQMLSDLAELAKLLSEYGVSEYFKIDFTLVSHMDYYTGIVFEGVNGNVGFPLASGGRYDELLGRFNRPVPATGFAVFFDRLIEAIGTGEVWPNACCILFIPEQRKEALLLASKKRADGESVVLQELAGVSDVDHFIESFDEVIYYTESITGRESGATRCEKQGGGQGQ
ncbi:MAG TPA: ATP phosphoribosyltransferase regulatory subunit [Bacillales bacterium]|nr:ATP phosphoribosyltransferase regulatory subunit [Bacillales bacterium]